MEGLSKIIVCETYLSIILRWSATLTLSRGTRVLGLFPTLQLDSQSVLRLMEFRDHLESINNSGLTTLSNGHFIAISSSKYKELESGRDLKNLIRFFYRNRKIRIVPPLGALFLFLSYTYKLF
jgi:hypothetical protein